jgi:hypothetical protein
MLRAALLCGAPDTTAATDDCSAHYFSLQDGVLASAWYSQGTRLLDVSDARPRHAGEVSTVRAPAPKPDPYAPVPVEDGQFYCPLFVDSPAAAASPAS